MQDIASSQDDVILCSENDWAGELKSDYGTWTRGVGCAICRSPGQEIRPHDFTMGVERQVDLVEAQDNLTEVLKAMRDLSK